MHFSCTRMPQFLRITSWFTLNSMNHKKRIKILEIVFYKKGLESRTYQQCMHASGMCTFSSHANNVMNLENCTGIEYSIAWFLVCSIHIV